MNYAYPEVGCEEFLGKNDFFNHYDIQYRCSFTDLDALSPYIDICGQYSTEINEIPYRSNVIERKNDLFPKIGLPLDCFFPCMPLIKYKNNLFYAAEFYRDIKIRAEMYAIFINRERYHFHFFPSEQYVNSKLPACLEIYSLSTLGVFLAKTQLDTNMKWIVKYQEDKDPYSKYPLYYLGEYDENMITAPPDIKLYNSTQLYTNLDKYDFSKKNLGLKEGEQLLISGTVVYHGIVYLVDVGRELKKIADLYAENGVLCLPSEHVLNFVDVPCEKADFQLRKEILLSMKEKIDTYRKLFRETGKTILEKVPDVHMLN